VSKSESEPIDWEAIERDYRSGSMSNRELGRWYQISESAIRKRAKAHGWTRTGTQGAQRAQAQVPAVILSPVTRATEVKQIIGRGRNLIERLLDELDAATTQLGALEEMIEIETANDQNEQRRNALMRAVGLPARATVLKNLAAAAKTLNETETPAARGKKEMAADAAATAGEGSDWGDDLRAPNTSLN
jgi:hypothetical protein